MNQQEFWGDNQTKSAYEEEIFDEYDSYFSFDKES